MGILDIAGCELGSWAIPGCYGRCLSPKIGCREWSGAAVTAQAILLRWGLKGLLAGEAGCKGSAYCCAFCWAAGVGLLVGETGCLLRHGPA